MDTDTLIKGISNIFTNLCIYNNINKINTKIMRNRNGISLNDAFLYRILYSSPNETKDTVAAKINNINKNSYTRQSFDEKEGNISNSVYYNILTELRNYYNVNFCNRNKPKLIAVDGTYNNDVFMNEQLNMGFYDITNGIPINVISYNKENKNSEIKCTIDYINKNKKTFKGNILVGDRGYYSFDFYKYLCDNNYNFIMRARGDADVLNPLTNVRKSNKKYNTIMNLRDKVRVINFNETIKKTIYTGVNNKKTKKKTVEIENNCVIITNLLDETLYPDELVLEFYRLRWDIEVYFKYIKLNFKFQHLNQSVDQYLKMYHCMQIITYLEKIIESYYWKNNKKTIKKNTTYKINKTLLTKGIFESLIINIYKNNLTKELFNNFCKVYIKITQNTIGRSFPRTSVTPFSKWYVKGYSKRSDWDKIFNAVIHKNIKKLNKNLRVTANKIKSINGKSYK